MDSNGFGIRFTRFFHGFERIFMDIFLNTMDNIHKLMRIRDTWLMMFLTIARRFFKWIFQGDI